MMPFFRQSAEEPLHRETGHRVSCTEVKRETGVKTRFLVQDKGCCDEHIQSSLRSYCWKNLNAFVFYVSKYKYSSNTQPFGICSMMSPYLICMVHMLVFGAADNNYILFTESVRTEAYNQGRSATDSQTNVRLPQTSYSTATRQHVINGLYDSLTLIGLRITRTHLVLCRTGSSSLCDSDNLGNRISIKSQGLKDLQMSKLKMTQILPSLVSFI